ncbi:MAG: FmdE, Molybdenum formylmethanofuran dehydrogenase operon [Methanosaeta sp. PtaB.Bin018]|jgi:formylmethanofuran dehydrogenase subunit E|nr:formylmethanofuran dehydrogenase [Methanothrix sp.]OPX76264.1 MAG: FmdE, Molybdenum formylmethanofuran dehydrogenase operon [Methanosaeta sp. PtaB.Bin018]OPY46239.1 MAG: FmdE, Molybdenum formylmethanofuran dehydrogenase operon [Methanosaeta sp. PtaU1.Bin016]
MIGQNDMDANSQMKDLSVVADFHGHLCAGLAFTYRIVRAALRELEISDDPGKRLIAVVETADACGIDTLQIVAGCTMGRGNLNVHDYGKHAYTLIDKTTGKAVRIVRRKDWDIDKIDPIAARLRGPVFAGTATADERSLFDLRMENAASVILSMPEESLFTIHSFSTKVPKKTKVFAQVECIRCSEMVAENRTVHVNGQPYCIPCSRKL